jgi:hypothetical protein
MPVRKIVAVKEAVQFIEDWRSGKSCKFKPGDVVESGSSLGVIQFGLASVGDYSVKWYRGPKPWHFIDGIGIEKNMKKSDKSNPLKYKYSEMVPGPSSDAIDRLNEQIRLSDERKAKKRTGKEVDAAVAALEEDISYRKEMKKVVDKDSIDKIVPDDEDDENQTVAEIDPVAEKREKIISED